MWLGLKRIKRVPVVNKTQIHIHSLFLVFLDHLEIYFPILELVEPASQGGVGPPGNPKAYQVISYFLGRW